MGIHASRYDIENLAFSPSPIKQCSMNELFYGYPLIFYVFLHCNINVKLKSAILHPDMRSNINTETL